MSESALVSIVVPVFNAESYLRASLESILAQTYPSLEVIVMDDASSDGSPEIAAQLARVDTRLRLQRQPENVGQFANVNRGIASAKGTFVAVYHADDIYEPEIVSREVAYLEEHPQAGAVFALATFIDEAGREFGRLDRLPPEIGSAAVLDYPLVLNAVLRHSSAFLPTPSAMVRREVYGEAGPYVVDYGIRGDIDMWLRIARRHPIGLLREYLLRYRVGTHNESRRYGYLRTEPDLFFSVVDRCLAEGDRRFAQPDALAAYEAHRSADLLVAAGNAYIVERRANMRELLRGVRPLRILACGRVQRWRLLALFAVLGVAAYLPHSNALARRLRGRWHAPPLAST